MKSGMLANRPTLIQETGLNAPARRPSSRIHRKVGSWAGKPKRIG